MKSFERCANSSRLNASLDCFRRVPVFAGLAGGAVGAGTSGAIRWVDAAEALSDCVRSIVTGCDAFESDEGMLCCECASGWLGGFASERGANGNVVCLDERCCTVFRDGIFDAGDVDGLGLWIVCLRSM